MGKYSKVSSPGLKLLTAVLAPSWGCLGVHKRNHSRQKPNKKMSKINLEEFQIHIFFHRDKKSPKIKNKNLKPSFFRARRRRQQTWVLGGETSVNEKQRLQKGKPRRVSSLYEAECGEAAIQSRPREALRRARRLSFPFSRFSICRVVTLRLTTGHLRHGDP